MTTNENHYTPAFAARRVENLTPWIKAVLEAPKAEGSGIEVQIPQAYGISRSPRALLLSPDFLCLTAEWRRSSPDYRMAREYLASKMIIPKMLAESEAGGGSVSGPQIRAISLGGSWPTCRFWRGEYEFITKGVRIWRG